MRVIATAGHVDHGKSRLVRALTGMEPDRWAEERRRGMTIDLGYAWTTLASGEQLAFVDVPGHQRFVTNMLAGVGPVPAVLLVVAADEGWRRQTSEHLDAVDALRIRHGLIAVTRTDLASAEQTAAVLADARQRVARSSLGEVPALAVSAETGVGLDELRAGLQRLVEGLPAPDPDERVRLWIDRAFTVRGSGTVVTGTLGAGRVAVGDELELAGRPVTVRGLQRLASRAEQVEAVARVAVNLRSVERHAIGRGDCLLTPGAWWASDTLDVALDPLLAEPHVEQVLHIGSASIPVRLRLLDPAGEPAAGGLVTARLSLARPIPVQAGDRAVLRDPGEQSVTAGVCVLDPDPPALTRRGAAKARGAELAGGTATTLAGQVRRRGAASRARMAMLGIPVADTAGLLVRGDWLIDPDAWQRWQDALLAAVDRHAAADPRHPEISEEAARQAVGLPEPRLLVDLVAGCGLRAEGGRISRPETAPALGAAERSLRLVDERLARNPFDAPERTELAELGLGIRDLAAAARTGRVLRLAPDLVVAPDALERAMAVLRALPQPFTASQARQALGTTRRVALPLLERLDAAGLTVRLDGQSRTVRG
ncbi:selenocysteine-specific translation elongation factor [Jatrophihabitans sp.]|uniref:selenocysteine-specific translation elongation factor n=1 Tax=Jatrophihabitans sp. TaxID=1932789 RepID=UPI002D1BB64D|nr:selenocysteine-specific translation elongation factor [Jatrophihabitans sp.]